MSLTALPSKAKPLASRGRRAKILPMPPLVQTLQLYRHEGLWCFDFPDKGIAREPFVEGMDDLIDAVLAEKPAPIENPVLAFSLKWTPACRLRLEWEELETRADGEWNRYRCPELNVSGWLCPCLLQFFDVAPSTIYFDLYGNPDKRGDTVKFTTTPFEASAP